MAGKARAIRKDTNKIKIFIIKKFINKNKIPIAIKKQYIGLCPWGHLPNTLTPNSFVIHLLTSYIDHLTSKLIR